MFKFARRLDKIEISGIRRMFDLAQKIKDPIDFSLGQPHFDIPTPIKEVAKRAIDDGFNRYTVTQGNQELINKVLEYLKCKYNYSNPEHSVIITGGATGALFLACTALVDQDDEVLIPDPFFVLYCHLVNVCNGTPVTINTYETNFRLTAELIKKHATKRSKILIFNNPVNPTGIAYTKEEVKKIAELARELNIIVISDEVYNHFMYDFEHETMLNHYENTLLIGAFSKTYGMPGWRLGYAVGPKPIIEKMITLQQFSFVCPSSIAQKAATYALDIDMDNFIRSEYKKKRDMAYSELKDIFRVVKPQGAFYIYPMAPDGDADRFVPLALENKVIIVPGKTGSTRNTHFRLSYAVDDDKLIKGLRVLKNLARK